MVGKMRNAERTVCKVLEGRSHKLVNLQIALSCSSWLALFNGLKTAVGF